MKRSDALPSASRNLQAEVGVTEFSAVPAYTPIDKIKRALRRAGYKVQIKPCPAPAKS